MTADSADRRTTPRRRDVPPASDDDAPPPVPRPPGRPSPDERFTRRLVGRRLALAWVVTQRLLPLAGLPWFLIAWFVLGTRVTP